MEIMNKYINLASQKAEKVTLPAPLALIREKALTSLSKLDVPTRKVETWKYTNLKQELDHNYSLENENETKTVNYQKVEGFYNLLFKNGILQKDLSDEAPFLIEPLDSLGQDKLLALVNNETELSNDFSEILNRSFLGKGYVFNFKTDEKLSKPILIHRHYTQENVLTNETNFFNLPKFSHVEILETIKNKGQNLVNISSHTFAGINSYLGKHTLQEASENTLVLYQDNVQVSKDAHYAGTIVNLGAKKSRSFLNVELTDANAQADVHGLYALNESQHHDTYSKIHHKAANTESRQVYKGIMNDSSHGVFTGKVRIDQDAQQVNAEQLNKNLLLTKKSHANSRPQLEIYADDVKCSHGSTTGQLSDDELFYFLSRGIKQEKARQILAKAFAYDVLLKIPNTKIQRLIQDAIDKKNIEVGQNVK